MIFCKESAVQQIDHLLHIYDGLSIENILDTEIVLGGHILVNRTAVTNYTKNIRLELLFL